MALLLGGKLNAFLEQLHCYCKVCKKVQKQKGIENAVVEDREADRKEQKGWGKGLKLVVKEGEGREKRIESVEAKGCDFGGKRQGLGQKMGEGETKKMLCEARKGRLWDRKQ